MQPGHIEVMAPAGNRESMMAAIKAGADSVYFGVEQLNMRARQTNNFLLSDLEEVAAICNTHGVKSYITLNTILYDHDLGLMKKIVDEAKTAGITAVIASDLAVMNYCKKSRHGTAHFHPVQRHQPGNGGVFRRFCRCGGHVAGTFADAGGPNLQRHSAEQHLRPLGPTGGD